MESIDLTLLLLFITAILAGFIDSIAGGGGLIALPALLSAGVPPVQALACNKFQSSVGGLTASIRFYMHGLFEIRQIALPFCCCFLGSVIGALVIQQLDPGFLNKLIPFLLILMAVYFFFSPSVKNSSSRSRKMGLVNFSIFIVLLIGFYDGFFGPGTGSFLILAWILLMGSNLIQAAAHARVLNFASNIGALLIFMVAGSVIYKIALTMAAGQIIGAFIGSKMVIKKGLTIIRPLLVTVCLLMSAKLLWENLHIT